MRAAGGVGHGGGVTQFGTGPPGALSPIVAQRNIIDARNVLDPGVWREAGWEYRALGMAADAEAMTRLDPSPWQA